MDADEQGKMEQGCGQAPAAGVFALCANAAEILMMNRPMRKPW